LTGVSSYFLVVDRPFQRSTEGVLIWGIVGLNGSGTPNVGPMGFLSDARIRAAKPKDKAYKLFDSRGLYLIGLDVRRAALAA